MRTRKKNPFKLSYLSIAVICCLALSVIFYCTDYMISKRAQIQNDLKKTELLMGDWETQIGLMKEVSLRISISNEYQPSQFRKNKYNEHVLLQDLEQYQFYSTLTKECFLYYGGNTIFHASGYTMDLNTYLKTLSVKERGRMWEKLEDIRDAAAAGDTFHTLSISGNIYVLIPFSVSESTGRSRAVLCFVVNRNKLEERFQMVSGGILGTLSLYSENELLYSSREAACGREQKHVLMADSSNGLYTLCYLPDHRNYIQNGLYITQFVSVLGGMILLLLIANRFAESSYRPIMEMSDKYRSEIAVAEDVRCENTLEEIDHMMASMLKSNMMIQAQIKQKQEMLKNQILLTLIEGSGTFDVTSYLDGLQIRLPGPYYYVISISYEKEEDISEEFLSGLQKELEELSCDEEQEYVYAVCYFKRKRLGVICSIAARNQVEELTEDICGVAESFDCVPLSGSGSICQSLSSLPASWMESMDNLKYSKNQYRIGEPQEFVYDSEELYRICAAMAVANETGALNGLNRLVIQLNKKPVSLILQQYIFADFLSEVTRQARKCRIKLSRKSISLIVSAKNVDNFKKAAEDLIRDFCEMLRNMKSQVEDAQSYRIYEYVNEHFAEYDLSIEKVADDLDISTAEVRQAVFKYTGKMYKDYLMFLRIEEAKVLLQENITVDEVCRKVGYSSISYFTKRFKAVTGVTPAKYRRGDA